MIGMAAAMAQPWEPVPHSEIIKWPVDAVQTPDGALWIAAAPQVYRYDGRRFETFGESQGLISRGAMYLAVDGTGAVLAGTTEGLFRMEGGQFRRIFEGMVRFVAVSEAGLVAISTGEGKLILGKEVGKIWKWHRVETPRAVWGQVSFDRHGAMLFGCAESICEVAADQAKDWSSLSIKNIRRTRPRLSQQHLRVKGIVILGVGRDRWGRIWMRRCRSLTKPPRRIAT